MSGSFVLIVMTDLRDFWNLSCVYEKPRDLDVSIPFSLHSRSRTDGHQVVIRV